MSFYETISKTTYDVIKKKNNIANQRYHSNKLKLAELVKRIMKESNGVNGIKDIISNAAKNGFNFATIYCQYDPLGPDANILIELIELLQEIVDKYIGKEFKVKYSKNTETDFYPSICIEWSIDYLIPRSSIPKILKEKGILMTFD